MAKPPEPPLSPVRSAQKSVLKRMGQLSSAVAEGAKTATGHAAQRLKDLDETAHITERFSKRAKASRRQPRTWMVGSKFPPKLRS